MKSAIIAAESIATAPRTFTFTQIECIHRGIAEANDPENGVNPRLRFELEQACNQLAISLQHNEHAPECAPLRAAFPLSAVQDELQKIRQALKILERPQLLPVSETEIDLILFAVEFYCQRHFIAHIPMVPDEVTNRLRIALSILIGRACNESAEGTSLLRSIAGRLGLRGQRELDPMDLQENLFCCLHGEAPVSPPQFVGRVFDLAT